MDYIGTYKGHRLFYEREHVLVYDQHGKFEFSADTVKEAEEGIDDDEFNFT